jgi:hypothetical protein
MVTNIGCHSVAAVVRQDTVSVFMTRDASAIHYESCE